MTLRIAAKYAQYTNFTSEPEGFAHKSDVLAAHCSEVGTDYGAIVRSANIGTVVGSSEGEVKDRLARIRSRIAPVAGEAATDGMLGSMSTPQAAEGQESHRPPPSPNDARSSTSPPRRRPPASPRRPRRPRP